MSFKEGSSPKEAAVIEVVFDPRFRMAGAAGNGYMMMMMHEDDDDDDDFKHTHTQTYTQSTPLIACLPSLPS